jgi:hypothetical protein
MIQLYLAPVVSVIGGIVLLQESVDAIDSARRSGDAHRSLASNRHEEGVN